jgi:hypothetical protein
MRWTRGEDTVSRLIEDRRLQRVTGAEADGTPWLERAKRTATTAEKIVDADPDSAYILAYDAARQACTALLAHQGLRPRLTAATTSSRRPCARSSGTCPAPSALSVAAATSSNTSPSPVTAPTPQKPALPSPAPLSSSTPSNASCPTSACSDPALQIVGSLRYRLAAF